MIDIGISCGEVAECRHRRPSTGRTNGRFLCVVLQFFLLAVCGTCGSSLRDEPATPFCVIDYRPRSTLGDCLAALSEFESLQRALLYCVSSDRSFAYMWGAGLRAHLKLSNQRGKIRTQRARRRVVTHSAAAPCEQTEVLGTKRVS